MNPIEYYTYMFPQLTLDIKEGNSQSEEYKNIALRGIFPNDLTFPLKTSGKEERIIVDTPVGKTECIFLPDREVFERFVMALGYKCEPVDIPKTTGAMFVSGLNCYRKILLHKEDFLKTHNEDQWSEEYDRFISNKENYKEIVLLISKGYYSALSPKDAGYDEEEYLRISKDIRIYHELTHHICRKLYLDHKDAIRDEVIADSIGVIYALKKYDALLIRKFLGIEGQTYRWGARLENYCDKEKINEAMEYCNKLIDKLEIFYNQNKDKKPFELLLQIENENIR